MALLDNAWYVNYGNGTTTGYYAVTPWTTLLGATAGSIIRQTTVSPALTERCFVCYNSVLGVGVTGATEPTWGTPTRGEKYASDGTVSWIEGTGIAALNGDVTNTPTWTQYRTSTASATVGQVIQNGAGTLLLMCITAGTMAALGSEPSWSAYTATGATTNDGTTPAVWVTLGAYNKYSIWKAPQARLANAFTATWGAAGNSFFVSSIHAETQSTALTLTSPGTSSNPCYIYCVKNFPATTPPGSGDLASTGSITGTSASGIVWGNYCYYYGLAFNNGTTATSASPYVGNGTICEIELDTCTIAIPYTGATGTAIYLGNKNNNAAKVLLNNTVLSFGTNTQYIVPGTGTIIWQNTISSIGGTVPSLFIQNNVIGAGGLFIVRGVDLSAITGTLVSAIITNNQVLFVDCELHSGVTIAATPQYPPASVDSIRSDSSGTNYQQQRYRYEGTLIPETTIIRTGGAQVTGTGIAWNLTTTANSKWVFPFETPLIAIQNSSTSPMTATVYGIWKTAALPNNDQIWIEAEYLGNGSFPLGSFATSTKANNLASGSPVSADTSAWGAGAAAYQTSHAYGAFTGVILAGNASPQQLWFMASHSGTGTSGGSSTIFNSQADGAHVTDNSGSNQIVWQAMTRFALTTASFTPNMAGQVNIKVKAALATTTFYVDPSPVL